MLYKFTCIICHKVKVTLMTLEDQEDGCCDGTLMCEDCLYEKVLTTPGAIAKLHGSLVN